MSWLMGAGIAANALGGLLEQFRRSKEIPKMNAQPGVNRIQASGNRAVADIYSNARRSSARAGLANTGMGLMAGQEGAVRSAANTAEQIGNYQTQVDGINQRIGMQNNAIRNSRPSFLQSVGGLLSQGGQAATYYKLKQENDEREAGNTGQPAANGRFNQLMERLLKQYLAAGAVE